jgi:glycosyltransferase involved in cell wall biosynthesis
MMRFHLLTPNVELGDAVSNDALGMCRWLRRHGHRARLYAQRCNPKLRRRVWPIRAYERYLRCPDDVLIYHHSVGWPRGVELYERSQNRRILRYHNVTPASFYPSYNRLFVKACKLGAQETARLVRAEPELCLADSAFNGSGLVEVGASADRCLTIPPFHAIPRLDRAPLNERLASRLGNVCHWLFVGRLSPNKGHRHVIRALGYYRRYLGREATLTLVGNYDPGLHSYWEDLRQEVRRWGLQDHVDFAGKVSRSKLRTYYNASRYFVCASEHEGFCVPLVEAMYHGLPIVAFASSAIPDTVADTGIVWGAPSPLLLAESIGWLEEHPEARADVIAKQRERYQENFTIEAIGANLDKALAHLLEGMKAHA